jgi:hypothetical protein
MVYFPEIAQLSPSLLGTKQSHDNKRVKGMKTTTNHNTPVIARNEAISRKHGLWVLG